MEMLRCDRYRQLMLFFIILISGLSCFSHKGFAQAVHRVEIPSSFNPVGSGARALGMGGAFIAVADDATAASWNPGGLIQLETPEISIVGAYFSREEDLSFGESPESNGSQNMTNGSLNYLSAAYPFTAFRRNMIVSINYQHLYDFTRDWLYTSDSETELTSATETIDYQQEGGLTALGLAYSIQLIPRFSLGLTLNYWGEGLVDNGWEQRLKQTGQGTYEGAVINTYTDYTEKYSFSGYNANIGFLWNINSRITVGGVFKSPFTANIEYQSSYTENITFPDTPDVGVNDSYTSKSDQELTMPMSYGIGMAYRFSDNFSTSFDIYRTEWDDFILKDENGDKTSPISGKPESESDVDPTHQARMGAEYLYIGNRIIVPVRGGVFYDPAPAEGSPDEFYGFSLGSGIAYKKIIFDMAYQYRFGNDVSQYIMENLDFSEDVQEHTIFASIIYHF